MTVGEAIRRGSVGTTQAFGAFWRLRRTGSRQMGVLAWGVCIESLCALGALCYAAEITFNSIAEGLTISAIDRFPVLGQEFGACPVCKRKRQHLEDFQLIVMIAHLNDIHHWTREQIADWCDEVTGDNDEMVIEVAPRLCADREVFPAESAGQWG